MKDKRRKKQDEEETEEEKDEKEEKSERSDKSAKKEKKAEKAEKHEKKDKPADKKRKKRKKQGSFSKALNGLTYFLLSVYALTSVLFTDGSGSLGGLLRGLLLGCLGPVGAIGIPACLATLFFFGGTLRRRRVMGRKLCFTLIGATLTLTVYHLALYGVPVFNGIVEITSELWTKATDGHGSGVIGGLLALGMGSALGRIPAIIILTVIALILFSFALCASPFGIWTVVGDLLCIERAPKNKNGRKNKSTLESSEAAEAIKSYLPMEPTFAEDDLGYGSAAGDVFSLSQNNGNSSTDDEYYEYGEDDEYDEYEYDDTELTASGYNESYGYSDTIDSFTDAEDAEYDEPVEPQRNEVSTSAKTNNEPAYSEEDDEEADDTDPFEPHTLVSRSRKFGKLFGSAKNAKNSAEGRAELEKAEAEAKKAAEQEEDASKKWESGSKYAYPSTTLLNSPPEKRNVSEEEVREVADKILRKLASFKVKASLVGYSIGPSITRYELAPGEGVRVSKISQLITDISLELASEGVRIEAPIPGKSAIGIEVPNKTVSLVSFRALAENPGFTKAKSKITVCIGQSVTGDPVFMDIDDMPHVLIAGQTKSGKSVAINCMLLSLLYRVSPDEVKLILIDPKRVEFNIYSRLPHLVMPVIDDPTKAAAALSWAVKEMERRYELMKEYDARNRDEYLENTADVPNRDAFPQIVIIIDELADLMLQVREHVEPLINRIAAKARACGMHLLVGTQRPSADVVTGLIKANIPARISFKVADQVDARIIGTAGAEKLLGKGDMLYHPTGGAKIRVQGAYVGGSEILRVIDYIVDNNGEASYDPDVLAQLEEEENSMLRVKKRGGAPDEDAGGGDKPPDPLLINAIEIAVENQSVSTSSLQRYLEVGYGRGAKLIDAMERLGIVGPPNGSKPREVFMTMEQYHIWRLEQNFDN